MYIMRLNAIVYRKNPEKEQRSLSYSYSNSDVQPNVYSEYTEKPHHPDIMLTK